MVTKDVLQADLAVAVKSRDSRRVSTLRMLLAAVHNREIELRAPLGEVELTAVITAGMKQRRESVEEYRKGGRDDLADGEQAELEILQAYLPPPIDEQALLALIEQAVADTGADGPRGIGLVMKWLMPRIAGRADGKLVNRLVQARLA